MTWDGIHEQIVIDNAAFHAAADSKGFDDGAHRAGAVLAEEAKTIAEWFHKCAGKCADVATVLRDTRAGQEELIREADPKIAAAKLPGEAEALVAEYRGYAEYQTDAGVAAAMSLYASFKKSSENVRALDLLMRWGQAPAAPPAQPIDHTSPGIEQGGDPKKTPLQEGSDAPATADAPTGSTGTSVTQPGVSPDVDAKAGKNKPVVGDEGLAASGPITQATPGASATPRPSTASPLGGSGAPSMGGLGSGGSGLGSGGGLPKMPGGLGSGLPGAGSNPLSSAMGQMPGTGSGLNGGAPGSASGTGAGSPLTSAFNQFNQGAAATAAMGGGIPAPPPAPASPSPALSAGGGPAAPASVGPGGGVSPAAAQPGVVSPAAPAAPPGGAGMGTGAGAPMMLPPGPMGPPAGAVPPPPPTMSAGGGGSPNASAPAAPSAASAAAGPTLIPASVVAAGQTAAARERRESADASAAKELVWKLQHAAYLGGSPMTGWAVGVFRSPSGTETVITSNDGAGYIPAGVFVPRSVRVVSTDPLVDDDFRQLWFGWADPARILVEYARLRAAQGGWRMVAAASTLLTPALRDAGVEHPPACTRETNPLLQPGVQVPAPVLDDMHVHRLAVLWPELYPRLLRIMDADPIYQDRIVRAVTAELIRAATSQAQPVDIPDAVRHIWEVRGGDREPTTQQWAKYNEEAQVFNGTTAMARPAFMTGGAGHPRDYSEPLAVYRAHWLVARTAEHIGGWAARPLPLPDMCYGAVLSGEDELPDMIVRALVSVEEDLHYEAPR